MISANDFILTKEQKPLGGISYSMHLRIKTRQDIEEIVLVRSNINMDEVCARNLLQLFWDILYGDVARELRAAIHNLHQQEEPDHAVIMNLTNLVVRLENPQTSTEASPRQ